jgi:hypothetical protein
MPFIKLSGNVQPLHQTTRFPLKRRQKSSISFTTRKASQVCHPPVRARKSRFPMKSRGQQPPCTLLYSTFPLLKMIFSVFSMRGGARACLQITVCHPSITIVICGWRDHRRKFVSWRPKTANFSCPRRTLFHITPVYMYVHAQSPNHTRREGGKRARRSRLVLMRK